MVGIMCKLERLLVMYMITTLVFLFLFLFPAVTEAATITVQGFTSNSIQNAVNTAKTGDTVFLPAGNYNFTSSVNVNKSLTIKGAAQLRNLCVPEYGTSFAANVPPTWSSTPSHCHTSNINLRFFNVKANNVRFDGLKFTGVTRPDAGSNVAVNCYGYDNITVVNCECTGQQMAVLFKDSYNNLVQRCYLHDNYRDGLGYGVHILGPSMPTGGAAVVIKECEFMKNRHDICTNSPLTKWVAEKNYFHDNETILKLAVVDIHSHGAGTLRAAVRNNIFVRTCPIIFKSGSFDITGNYFDSSCGDSSIARYPGMIYLGQPVFDGKFTNPVMHDIYISGNTKNHSKPLIQMEKYNYAGTTRYVAYNVYENGVLWESQNRKYLPRDTSPRPLLGEVYFTEAGTSKKVDAIEPNTWYDLHAMACDPQGADNIARIGIQLVNKNKYAYTPGNTGGVFRGDGNYYLETDGRQVYVRKMEGSSAWTAVANSTEDLYVDTNHFSYRTDGSHRKHFQIRFKLLNSAAETEWCIHGYARDAQGNLPHSNLYEQQIGWFITVGEGSGSEWGVLLPGGGGHNGSNENNGNNGAINFSVKLSPIFNTIMDSAVTSLLKSSPGISNTKPVLLQSLTKKTAKTANIPVLNLDPLNFSVKSASPQTTIKQSSIIAPVLSTLNLTKKTTNYKLVK